MKVLQDRTFRDFLGSKHVGVINVANISTLPNECGRFAQCMGFEYLSITPAHGVYPEMFLTYAIQYVRGAHGGFVTFGDLNGMRIDDLARIARGEPILAINPDGGHLELTEPVKSWFVESTFESAQIAVILIYCFKDEVAIFII